MKITRTVDAHGEGPLTVAALDEFVQGLRSAAADIPADAAVTLIPLSGGQMDRSSWSLRVTWVEER